MIYSAVEKSMTIKTDALVMRTINNMIAETLDADKTAFGFVPSTHETVDYSSASTVRCVNLLKLYNDKTEAQLTAATAITTPDFIRFAAYIMGLYSDRLQTISTLFNVGGKERFTPKDVLHTVLLSDFAAAAKTYLYADTYHEDNVLLPKAETVASWQATGKDYAFEHVSKIDVKSASGANISVSGVLGVVVPIFCGFE
jgi:hypothetical protein